MPFLSFGAGVGGQAAAAPARWHWKQVARASSYSAHDGQHARAQRAQVQLS
jgi:hypothetical protein